MSEIEKLAQKVQWNIRISYVAQAFSVAVFTATVYTGYRAYLHGSNGLVLWNAFIFGINVFLFWMQGAIRERAVKLKAEIEEILKEHRPPSQG